MDAEKILARMVQVGTVSDIDAEKKKVRVKFPGTEIVSGWLYVLQRPGTGLSIKEDGGHSHEIKVKDTYTGRGDADIKAVPNHDHKESVTTTWLPKVNDRVVVLYLPIANGDGFVLGGL